MRTISDQISHDLKMKKVENKKLSIKIEDMQIRMRE